MPQYHTPVLLEESVDLLDIRPDGTYADLTFGGGGHSRRILERLGPAGRLYAFDQDRDTLANRPDDGRFCYVESNFRFLRGSAAAGSGRWTAFWPIWASRRTISTPWSAASRSAGTRRSTCA